MLKIKERETIKRRQETRRIRQETVKKPRRQDLRYETRYENLETGINKQKLEDKRIQYMYIV